MNYFENSDAAELAWQQYCIAMKADGRRNLCKGNFKAGFNAAKQELLKSNNSSQPTPSTHKV